MIELLSSAYSRHYERFKSKINEHIPYYFFRFQHEGHCTAIMKDRTEILQPGDLLICKPGDPCELVVESAAHDQPPDTCLSADYFMFCRGPWLDEWWRSQDRSPVTSLVEEDNLLQIWGTLAYEQSNGQYVSMEVSTYLLQAFCIVVDRVLGKVQPSMDIRPKSLAASQIKYYIEQHCTEKFLLEDVARFVGLSVSRSIDVFKKTYGRTITEYTNHVRLTLACKQIRFSDLNLADIAESVGFHSYTYFHRIFRSKYGLSPLQFRKLCR